MAEHLQLQTTLQLQIDLVLLKRRQLVADSGWLVVGLVFGAIVGFEYVGAEVAAVQAVVVPAASVEAETEMCFVAVAVLGQSAKP